MDNSIEYINSVYNKINSRLDVLKNDMGSFSPFSFELILNNTFIIKISFKKEYLRETFTNYYNKVIEKCKENLLAFKDIILSDNKSKEIFEYLDSLIFNSK